MTTWQLTFALIMVFSRVILPTMQLASIFPIRLAPIASSACPSCEEIDTLHRNAEHLIEEEFLTRPCSSVGVMAGHEWPISTCLTFNKPVLPTGTSPPLQLEDVDDLLLVIELLIL